MIQLDILSDPICPWCYIGKSKLDAAVARTGTDPFVRRWRMFRLNPEMPAEGMDRRAYLEAKFGGPAGADQVYGRIAEVTRAAGLDADYTAIRRTPNTLDAHRLLRWAEAERAQDLVSDGLFAAYFRDGRDISERETLLEISERAGLVREVIDRLLDGPADREALEAEEREAREMGVTGVPCFVINGRYVLQGAQETETWVRVIEELNTALASAQEGAGGPNSASQGSEEAR
ncbi:MAG: DsbA family protein [Pikeienuella sp.]